MPYPAGLSLIFKWLKRSARYIAKIFRYLTFRGPLKPLQFQTTGFEVIPASQTIDEETLEHFNPDEWYPVNVGDVFHDRYQVIGKLGYGTTSTVWLGRNLETYEYVAMKFLIGGDDHLYEGAVMEEIADVNPSHPGYKYLRHLIEIMWVARDDGRMQFVLVQQPMWQSWKFLLEKRLRTGKLPIHLLKAGLRCLFRGLQYLHEDCQLIHTDIKADNVLHAVKDESIFQRYVDGELATPTARKFVGDYTIYESTGFVDPHPDKWGEPVLCDFGAAVSDYDKHTELAQPLFFRSPEVIMGMEWSYPIDIWNVGALIWYLFQDHLLFHPKEEIGLTDRALLADIVAVLGPPPLDLLARGGERMDQYFAPDGTWIADVAIPPSRSLEDCVSGLDERQKEGFMDLVKGMLQWRPEDRRTAGELADHPWLNME